MKYLILLGLFLALPCFADSSDKIFRLHLSNEPSSLDPNKQRSSSSSYALGNLYRNLFIFDDEKGLQLDLAVSCKRDKKRDLSCKLKKGLKWSDGSPLTAADFLRTYRKIIQASTQAPRADFLFNLKNAEEIYQGKMAVEKLGVTAPDSQTLSFEFAKPDPDFEYKLASFLIAPTKETLDAYTGPYQLKEWKRGQKLILTPNTQYPGHAQRPQVELLFIGEDSVALQLYEKNELHFLRRLPTLFIPRYKERADFFFYPVLRFDYLGFGPELKSRADVRSALTYSLNYSELQKIFSSKGRPGCAGLPDHWFPEQAPCFEFQPAKAQLSQKTTAYDFMFSSLGGEDHRRATEWMQNQWLKNAKIKTRPQSRENKIFLKTLRDQPPALFRKGVSPDRPTCLATLETFAENNPENYIRLKSAEFTLILEQLAQETNKSEQKKLCKKGVDFLMTQHLLIPLGPIHFAMLAKKEFQGWKLNQMNQLDLSGLHFKP